MAAYVKFQCFVEDVAEKKHNLGSDTLVVALTNSAPNVSTNTVITDITEVAYTNLSTRNLTISSSAQTTGTYKLVIADIDLTSTGGTTGPFRYVVIYNDTSATDALICYFDYGSSITLADGEKITLDFDGTNGLLQLA